MRWWRVLGGGMGVMLSASVVALEVGVTEDLSSIEVLHGDARFTIERNQDVEHRIADEYARTSRPCPPFCIQPMEVASGVKTIGELELLDFMQRQVASGSGMVIDARSSDWYAKGTIPTSINIPYTDLDRKLGADDFVIEFFLEQLGVKRQNGVWDFFVAKDVVLWCNGPWCQQSPTAIRALLELGYPAEKILYYRGGMQMWQLMGFPVVDPAE